MEEFQAIRLIFDEALELEDKGRREAFLDRACAGSQKIKTEVEELLVAYERAAGFMVIPSEANSDKPDPELWEEGWEGRRFGPYTLLSKLGEGGVGMVFLAEQEQPIRRRVAVKLVKPGMDSRSVLARFELERKVLERMDHPNIARVLDAGMTPQGRPYFVMEWVKGERITDFCNSRCLTLAERLRLVIQVCHAIEHAHQKGILHRDLKPSNVLVLSDSERGAVPKVIDFGIAKATSTDGAGGDYATVLPSNPSVDGVLGTPAYMSPEQASEGRPDLDTRTDIYSLGVLLYELIAGQPPFATQWLMDRGLAVMRQRIQEVEPPKPSAFIAALPPRLLTSLARERGETAERLSPQVRGDIDWIVLKAIAKQRHLRYATANELAMDLERHLSHEAVVARPPTSGYLFGRFIRRNRLVVGFLAAVGLIFVFGLAVSGWQWRRALRAEHLQRVLRQEAEQAQRHTLFRAYSADMKVASVALEAGNVGQTMNLLDRYAPSARSPSSNPESDDIRGFEWHYLHHLAHGDELASFSHHRMVAAVRSPPNGEWVAASSCPGDVRVWDSESGALLESFPALESRNMRSSLDLSSDGKLLAYLSEKAVIVRDTSTWLVVASFPGVWYGLRFSPVGQRIALLGAKEIQIKDPFSGYSVRTLLLPQPLQRNDGDLSFCGKEAEWIAVRSVGDLWVLEVSTGMEIWKPRLPEGSLLTAISTSGEGGLLAVGDSVGRLITFDLERRQVASVVEAHPGWLLGLAFSDDGKRIATGGGDQTIRLWPVASDGQVGKSQATLRGHVNEVWSVEFSPDGEHVLSGGKDTLVKRWRAEAPAPTHTDVALPPLGDLVGFSDDGQYYRIIDTDRQLVWIPTRPGAEPVLPLPLNTLLGTRDLNPWQLSIGSDSFLVLTRDGFLETRSLPRGEVQKRVRMGGATNSVLASVSPDRRWLVKVSLPSRTASLLDATSGAERAALPKYVDNESAPRRCRLVFSRDGRWLAYSGTDFGVSLWDLAANQLVTVLQGHAWNLYCLAFSPDSKRLASSSWDGSVAVWDVEARKMAVPLLKGHFAGVNSVSFLSDGRTLVTQGGEGTMKFWNTATGTEVLSLPGVSTQWACPVSTDLRHGAWLDGASGRLRVTSLSDLSSARE